MTSLELTVATSIVEEHCHTIERYVRRRVPYVAHIPNREDFARTRTGTCRSRQLVDCAIQPMASRCSLQEEALGSEA